MGVGSEVKNVEVTTDFIKQFLDKHSGKAEEKHWHAKDGRIPRKISLNDPITQI